MMVTRLQSYVDETAEQADDPITFLCMLHDPDEAEYHMLVTCGTQQDIVHAAAAAVDERRLDLGLSDWKPI